MQPVTRQGQVLPEPDPTSARHSERVARYLAQKIEAAGGSISFASFMHEVLYAPGLGYYQSGTRKFGSGGDFVTAPEISPLFGRVLARQVAGLLEQCGATDILELGAGSGALATSMLAGLAELGRQDICYRILEISPELTERQRHAIESAVPGQARQVAWETGLPERFRGVIIANEVADALPVERFRVAGRDVQQARVAGDEAGFHWQYDSAPAALERAVRDIERDIGRALADGYESEWSRALPQWIGDVVSAVEEGAVLLFDYGVSRHEYYAPDRDSGWLRCHFRQFAHADPLRLPGIQDVTSWVDFTAVAQAAAAAGARVDAYLAQADFLLCGGLERELEGFDQLPIPEQVRLSGEVKLLTLPAEMGETFKCIALCRGACRLPESLRPFDRAAAL